MKKLICTIVTIAVISLCGITVLAGDVPESLLHTDKALVFFGKVVSYDADSRSITVLPTQRIKGGMALDMEWTYENGVLVGEEGFSPVDEEIYLMAFYDDNNPLYVFQTSGTDTETLKIEGIDGQGMWERMQKYLNEGAFEEKEAERVAEVEETMRLIQLQINQQLALSPEPKPEPAPEPTATPEPPATPEPESIPERETNYGLYGVIGVIIIVGAAVFLRKKK